MFITMLVCNRLVSFLTQEMQTKIPATDHSRIDIVKFGRFLDNPNTPGKNIYLSVSGGSQTDPELQDNCLNAKDNERVSIYIPTYEIGGGKMWWRRGEVRIGCFLSSLKLSEVDTGSLAYNIFGRVQDTIARCPVADLVDSYGEQAVMLLCFASQFMESGGQGTYIWRGSVKWQFLSERQR